MTTPCRKSISVNIQQPPGQLACCMPDILSIRQQLQARSSMTDIESGKTTKTSDQTEVCQCDLCREDQDIEAATTAVLTLLAERETSGVRTLPDNSNAATGQPEGKATIPAEKQTISLESRF